MLKLEPNAGYVVGIKVREDGLTTVMCDLDGHVGKMTETIVPLVGQPAAGTRAIVKATRDVSDPTSRTLAVGVAVPGVIEPQTGACRSSHRLGWHDVEMAAPLRQKLRLPVWVDNDVNTLAVAEKWADEGVTAQGVVTLNVGRDVGMGHRHRPFALSRRNRWRRRARPHCGLPERSGVRVRQVRLSGGARW